MFKNLILKKIVAAFMLVVFAFSITPTIVLHNWLANHADTYKKVSNSKTQQVGKQTFNCHCNNIVAESPFTEPDTFNCFPPIQIFSIVTTVDFNSLPSSPTIFYSLRGPPVV